MATITIQVTGTGLPRLTVAMKQLVNRSPDAYRRALNHTGDKARTRVKRALSNQIGATQSAIVKYGKLRAIRANYSRLEYQIEASGGPIPIKHFKARQTAKGVTAAPWKNRRLYTSGFIVKGLGGHAFWREGKSRLPLKRIAGPNIPKELIKDESAAAFYSVAADLPRRIAHEIRVITNGVVS